MCSISCIVNDGIHIMLATCDVVIDSHGKLEIRKILTDISKLCFFARKCQNFLKTKLHLTFVELTHPNVVLSSC